MDVKTSVLEILTNAPELEGLVTCGGPSAFLGLTNSSTFFRWKGLASKDLRSQKLIPGSAAFDFRKIMETSKADVLMLSHGHG